MSIFNLHFRSELHTHFEQRESGLAVEHFEGTLINEFCMTDILFLLFAWLIDLQIWQHTVWASRNIIHDLGWHIDCVWWVSYSTDNRSILSTSFSRKSLWKKKNSQKISEIASRFSLSLIINSIFFSNLLVTTPFITECD